MSKSLIVRIEQLESSIRPAGSEVPELTSEERALQVEAVLKSFLARGVLIQEPDGSLRAGNLPGPGHERALATLLITISSAAGDQDQGENVRLCEV